MKTSPWKSLATVAVLGTTALLLVADSPPELECTHPEQRVSFSVSGSCGPEGTVTLFTRKDACDIEVEGGAAAGLPSQGRFLSWALDTDFDLRRAGWLLEGSTPLPSQGLDGGASGDAGSELPFLLCGSERVDQQLRLDCEDPRPQGSSSCQATFTPR